MPNPTVIFIDSSTLRGLSPRGNEARALQGLVSVKAVEIHVSTVVEREVGTALADEPRVSMPLNWAPDAAHAKLKEAFELLRTSGPVIEKGVKEWLDKLGAIRHAPTGKETKRVFNAYFEGKPPFKGKKNRSDMPDAFIVESLRTYASGASDKIYFITKDVKLSEAAALVPKVEVRSELLALLTEIDIARPVLLDEMLAFCRIHVSDLESAISQQLGETLVRHELTAQPLPSDNGDATVSSYGEVTNIVFGMEDADPVGEDVVVIPFECIVDDCLLDFFVYKYDWYALDDELSSRMSVADSNWNDHYVMLQTETALKVVARLLVEVSIVENPAGGKRELAVGDIDIEIDEVNLAYPELYTPKPPTRKRILDGASTIHGAKEVRLPSGRIIHRRIPSKAP